MLAGTRKYKQLLAPRCVLRDMRHIRRFARADDRASARNLFGELQVYVDRGALARAAALGRDEFDAPPDNLRAALRTGFDREPTFVDLRNSQSLVADWALVPAGVRYLDLTAVLDLPGDETRRYEHSKLYVIADSEDEFTEVQVICFRFRWLRRVQTVRLLLPEVVRLADRARFRLDPFPYCSAGRAAVHSLRFAREDANVEASRVAGLYALKEHTLHAVQAAEEAKLEVCSHYPSSMSVELTARCNLTCSHCSSHGEPDLHRRYNRMPEMSVERLKRLADEAFPALTALGIVGRGEPFAVSNRLWSTLVDRLRRDRVYLTAVTNSTLMGRRVTAELMPLLETLTVSVDGGSQQTFGRHRGGAQLESLLERVAAYDDLRRASGLARRPRLGFSWTPDARQHQRAAAVPGTGRLSGARSLLLPAPFRAPREHQEPIDPRSTRARQRPTGRRARVARALRHPLGLPTAGTGTRKGRRAGARTDGRSTGSLHVRAPNSGDRHRR